VTHEKLIDQGMGPIVPAAAERALASGDPGEISMALLRMALHGPDWQRAEEAARGFTTHPDAWVRRNPATALGHVARVRGTIDRDLSVPALARLLDDAEVAGWAEAALDDVEMYVGSARAAAAGRTAVSSSSVVGVGYDEATQTLEVEFRNGGIYQYLDIPAEEYARLRCADSPGRCLDTRIKPRYEVRKLRTPG
jgi:hypothetical protein